MKNRPPNHLRPRADSIPEGPKRLSRRVASRYEERVNEQASELRLTKVPIHSAIGRHASLDDALQWYEVDDLDCVGLDLTDGGISGLNIDHSASSTPDTGEQGGVR